ncbi:MAG: type III-A CRISPR-associated protein Csm2 [Spirochaetes bacterium]|nr:MAG: type III-A CRISPR-associated protein Csm2 [Spirochaetota bacterium]
MNGLGELKTLTKNLGRKLLLKQKNKNYRLDVKGEVEELKRFLKESHKNFVEELFLKEDGEVLVSVSEALGALLVGSGVSSSMIRNIFGYVKKLDLETMNMNDTIQKEITYKLRLLSPKLAYIIGRAGRSEKEALTLLKIYFDNTVEKIGNDKKKFKTFVDFFESILAYHKYYGGK